MIRHERSRGPRAAAVAGRRWAGALLLLALVLLLTACVPSLKHSPVSFADMRDDYPDLAGLQARFALLCEQVRHGHTERALEQYDQMEQDLTVLQSRAGIAQIRSYLDVTDADAQSNSLALQSAYTNLVTQYLDLGVKILEGEMGDAARARWGEDYAQSVQDSAKLYPPQLKEQLDQETQLVQSYTERLVSFTAKVDGQDLTVAEAMDSQSPGVLEAFSVQANQELGGLFLQLRDLRNEIANQTGYASYAAYAYDAYTRDFTPQDAQALHDAVKAALVPLYPQCIQTLRYDPGYYGAAFTPEEVLRALKIALLEFRGMSDSLLYMERYQLYDFSDSPNKRDVGLTTFFSEYGAPYTLYKWQNNYQDAFTVFHEFGHYNAMYRQGVSAESIDLSEIHSQALELLLLPVSDSLFGRSVGTAQRDRLTDALYAVISGCMEDEFQQQIFAHPEWTLEQINAAYQSLGEQYGLPTLGGTSWVFINHHFEAPFYYISYATSMLSSLQIWEQAQTDRKAAVALYLRIVDSPTPDYLAVLNESGLKSPFAPGAVDEVAQAVGGFFGLALDKAA